KPGPVVPGTVLRDDTPRPRKSAGRESGGSVVGWWTGKVRWNAGRVAERLLWGSAARPACCPAQMAGAAGLGGVGGGGDGEAGGRPFHTVSSSQGREGAPSMWVR